MLDETQRPASQITQEESKVVKDLKQKVEVIDKTGSVNESQEFLKEMENVVPSLN